MVVPSRGCYFSRIGGVDEGVMAMEDDRAAGGVQSAEVALTVLRVLAECGGDLPLSRLAAATGMPAAKVHRYVVSLQRAGFVEQAGRSANYTLGGEALRVGLAALARLDVVAVGSDAAADLRDRTGQAVLLAVWGEQGPIIVRWFELARPVTVNARIGSVMPLVSSATGQVFAAWMPWAQIAPLVEAELASLSPALSIDAARALFAQVREAGLSVVFGSMLAGIQALGAPVFGADGTVSAALTVLGTQGSFDPAPDGATARALRAASEGLSRRIGAGAGRS